MMLLLGLCSWRSRRRELLRVWASIGEMVERRIVRASADLKSRL
uniref:D-xylose-proton symporter-like 3ic isoform X2 n=1 Tax=Rhizophora mucronata TaxID=61149 RepID=A0A2P2KD84_RHIMU